MTNKEIKGEIAHIYLLLDRKKLREVFDSVYSIIADLQHWQLSERHYELETTYKYMLQYLTEGVKDPRQQLIYTDLLRSCYQLTDAACLQWHIRDTAGLYFDKKRNLMHHSSQQKSLTVCLTAIETTWEKISLASMLNDALSETDSAILDLWREMNDLTTALFHAVWLNELLTPEEALALEQFLDNELNSEMAKSIIISALTMSLLFTFDERKALILFSSYENDNEAVRQRALVGLLLFLRKYDTRLWLYPQITGRLDYLCESKDFVVNVRDILLQFIMSKETEQITKKIKEEIIPEMLRISPELNRKIRMDDLLTDTDMEDRNPEWEEILEQSGLKSMLEEFSELQMEGADIMHSSFSNLKTYTFFDEISNWFLPFYANPMFFRDFPPEETKQIVGVLKESNVLCNSDRYSFFYSTMQMPDKFRKMMTAQFAEQSEGLKDIQKEELPGTEKQSSLISKHYIQDLYRFFKIHPRKREFEDIFEKMPDLIQTKSIGRIVADKDSRLIIGEYYFNRNHYREAICVFDDLIDEIADDGTLYQKKGYCLQKLGDTEQALQAYLHAELLNAGSSWIIKKIAYCYRILKKPEEALAYYRKAELLNPDNLSVQLCIGHCFLELGDYAEALKYYFKVEYLDKHSERAWRPIAWCSFLIGKYEQANDYFEKILSNRPDASDYLNYGHVQLVNGDINRALGYYQSAVKAFDGSMEKFDAVFNADLPELLRQGVHEEDVPLILDRLMYDMKQKNKE